MRFDLLVLGVVVLALSTEPASAQVVKPYLQARNANERCAALTAFYERAKAINGPVTFRADRYPVQVRGQIAPAFVEEEFPTYFGAPWASLNPKQRATIAKDIRACPAPIINQFADTIAEVFTSEGAERQGFDQQVAIWQRTKDVGDVKLPEATPFGRPLGQHEAEQRQFERLIYSDARVSVGASYKYITCNSIGPTFSVALDIADDHAITHEEAADLAANVLAPLAHKQCPKEQKVRFKAFVFSRRTAVTETGQLIAPGSSASVTRGGLEPWLLQVSLDESGPWAGKVMEANFDGVEKPSVTSLRDHYAAQAAPKVAQLGDPNGVSRLNYTITRQTDGLDGLKYAQLIQRIAQGDGPLVYVTPVGDSYGPLPDMRKLMYPLTGAIAIPRDAGALRRRGFFYAAALFSDSCRDTLGDRASLYTQEYQTKTGEKTEYAPYLTTVTEYWAWAKGKTFYLDRDYRSLFIRIQYEEAAEAMSRLYAASRDQGLAVLSPGFMAGVMSDTETLGADVKTYMGRIGCRRAKTFLRNWYELLAPPVRADAAYPLMRTEESPGVTRYIAAAVPSGVSPSPAGLPLDQPKEQAVEVRGQREAGDLYRYRVAPYSLRLIDPSVASQIRRTPPPFEQEMARSRARVLVCEYDIGDNTARINRYWLAAAPPTQQEREQADGRVRPPVSRCPDRPE